jgi:hypothetical protein
MNDFLAGAVTLAYVIAVLHFLHFWRRTSDRLFFNFALAFGLLALNQLVVFILGADDARGNYAYILRVLGFILILVAIVDKNLFGRRRQ